MLLWLPVCNAASTSGGVDPPSLERKRERENGQRVLVLSCSWTFCVQAWAVGRCTTQESRVLFLGLCRWVTDSTSNCLQLFFGNIGDFTSQTSGLPIKLIFPKWVNAILYLYPRYSLLKWVLNSRIHLNLPTWKARKNVHLFMIKKDNYIVHNLHFDIKRSVIELRDWTSTPIYCIGSTKLLNIETFSLHTNIKNCPGSVKRFNLC